MWQVTRNSFKFIALVFVLAILSIVGAITVLTPTRAQEQSQHKNMRELLESLNTQIEESEEPFKVVFKFAEPLRDNNEVFWAIPYSSQEDDIDRWIGEIGDDFICFYERGGSSYTVLCTPFSNIVTVGYLVP